MNHIQLFKNEKMAKVLMGIFLTIICIFFLLSLGLPDKAVSERENRTLTQKPSFSFSTLFDGTYISTVETYYSDQFPARDLFLDVNSYLDMFVSRFAPGDTGVIITSTQNEDDFSGQALSDVEDAKDAAD